MGLFHKRFSRIFYCWVETVPRMPRGRRLGENQDHNAKIRGCLEGKTVIDAKSMVVSNGN